MTLEERCARFAEEYTALCRRLEVALCHEDVHGAFYLSQNHLEENIAWALAQVNDRSFMDVLNPPDPEPVVEEADVLKDQDVPAPPIILDGASSGDDKR